MPPENHAAQPGLSGNLLSLLLNRSLRALRYQGWSDTKVSQTFAFSLPAIKTCPGRSQLCASVCYANRSRFRFANVQDSLDRRYRLSRRPDFVQIVNQDLAQIRPVFERSPHQKYICACRIHVSGDFYSANYARKWLAIIRANPDVYFFTYTRSWRVRSIRPYLRAMSRLPNCKLLLSCDRETGLPPRSYHLDRLPIAWMALDDQDVPPRPVRVVFRVRRQTVQKKMGNSVVCPAENGTGQEVHCLQCRHCFQGEPGALPPDQLRPSRISLPVLSA